MKTCSVAVVLFCLVSVSIVAASDEMPLSIGQHFILTLPQTSDSTALYRWLERYKPAGVMLLSSHCTDRKKTKKLIDTLQKDAVKIGIPPLIVAIDWEGGIIARMHEMGGFVSIPSPYSLARIGRSACFCAGMIIGQQLHDIGINCDFAPSVDLFNNAYPTLATRCFSDDPAVVADCAIAFAQGLLTQGVVPVIKHFPGLGLGVGDTHLQGVTVNFDDTTFKRHTQPFVKAMDEGLPCVMAGHARCAAFDNLPATLSKKAVDFLKQANPNALLITDDFSMKGVNGNQPLATTMLTSLLAGYHLIIYSGAPCSQEAILSGTAGDQASVLDALSREIKAHDEYKKFLADQAHAVVLAKEQLFGHAYPQTKVTVPAEALARNLARRAIKIRNRRNYLFSREAQGDIQLFTVDLPKIRPSEAWFIGQDGKSYLARRLAFMTGRTVNEHILNPRDEASVERLRTFIKKCDKKDDLLVQTFFFGSGQWNAIQSLWLELIKEQVSPGRITIFSLGHPSEEARLPQATILELGSFHTPMIDAALFHLSTRPTITGAQRLVWHPEKYLKGKRFGLLCHKPSSVMSAGNAVFLPDMLYPWARKQNDQTRLVALFSPEHGLLGTHHDGATVASDITSKWGCPIYSLHGSNRKPSPEMLKGLDLIIIDMQDVGVRCYTYLSTLQQMLEEAKKQNLDVLVLDRPNPLFFWDASGPALEPDCVSFVGMVPTRFVYGSTIGKLAKELNKSIGARLSVLEIIGDAQAHDCFFTEQFIATSPNLASLAAIHSYLMSVFIEGTNYSEGRGTNYPFQQIGAPWVDGDVLAETLNARKCSGIYFQPVVFTPRSIKDRADAPKHEGTECRGVFIHIIDETVVDPTYVARTILTTLFEMYPEQSAWTRSGKRFMVDLLAGTSQWRLAIAPNE